MIKIFIDGKEGTTGLRINERLAKYDDVEVITLPEEKRKDPAARKEALNSADVAFLCLPDAAAIESVSLVENENTVIIDTSTAHRTADGWTYGFPELSEGAFEAIKKSKRIAVPGCHASGFISLVAPIVAAGILPQDAMVTSHSITGYSGGGKKMIAEYEGEDRSILLDSPRQYGLTQKHKHLPEMKAVCGLENEPIFCPIVSDFYSGMTVTVPLFASQLADGYTAEDIKNVYKNLYKGPIVKYTEEVGEGGFAAGNTLSGNDGMTVGVSGNDERILLVSNFDNLGKGSSGAAIQCLNIVLGRDMTYSLDI